MLRTLHTRALCAAASIAVATTPLLAQNAPPQPSKDGAYSPVVGYLVLLLLGGIVIAISLYPSKRSHQDV